MTRYHPDPLTDAIIAHQRSDITGCHCGWGELGRSWAEHLAGVIRPIMEADVRRGIVAGIQLAYDDPIRAQPRDPIAAGERSGLGIALLIAVRTYGLPPQVRRAVDESAVQPVRREQSGQW